MDLHKKIRIPIKILIQNEDKHRFLMFVFFCLTKTTSCASGSEKAFSDVSKKVPLKC